MAKELPYFKFEPNQWENGNIQMLSRQDKGLFIDLCSMYWSRLGDVPLKLAIQKLCAGNATALNPLCDEKIIEILEGNIFIKFLSEQLNEFEDASKQNSKNAKEGWEKRRKQKDESDRNATALNPQSESDAIREDKNRGNEIRKDIYKSFNHLSITKEDFEKLKIDFKEKDILSCFDRIENFKENSKYTSLYLTAKQWLEKEYNEKDKSKKNEIVVPAGYYIDPKDGKLTRRVS